MLPAISAAIDPTDRSMPPEMITNVMPTAMIPMNDVRVSTFIMLSTVAKSRLSSVPAMHRTIRPNPRKREPPPDQLDRLEEKDAPRAPCARKPVDQKINVALRANIDAARRLV